MAKILMHGYNSDRLMQIKTPLGLKRTKYSDLSAVATNSRAAKQAKMTSGLTQQPESHKFSEIKEPEKPTKNNLTKSDANMKYSEQSRAAKLSAFSCNAESRLHSLV